MANLKRDLRYGLNYYSITPLPECSQDPRPLRIVQATGMPPQVVAQESGLIDPRREALYPHVSGNKP